ncbi:MAG: hypothetical protein M9894_33310 [Planctomycetes bacterium]|nr:hypothetical protein [Planctomycetota bacterium]
MNTAPATLLLLPLLLLPAARAQDEREGEVVLAGFEDDADLKKVGARGATLALERGRAPEGEGWLVATAARPDAPIVVRFEAPGDLAHHDGLAFHVRARLAEGARPARLRLRALDAAGAELFQRRLSDALKGWSSRSEPFAHWRWGERVGRWSEVRALEVEATGAAALEVDHVRLLPGARGERSALPDTTWLAQLAFPDDAVPWTRDVGPFRLVAPAALATALSSDGALERAAARLRPLAAWLDRVAPEALRPVDDGPVVVLILPDAAAYGGFFARLGSAWRVVIASPRGAGYAVQDLCAVVHDPAQGLDRPVIAHEATHAVVARRLRLVPGDPRHAWLQEGLASYVQLCLHPGSFELRAWRRAFVAGVKDEGPFRPLRTLVDGGVGEANYAQLASLVGFLLAERPGWVGALARGLADREPVADVLARLGSSLERLEADWLAWGRATYGTPAALEAGRHFPLPREWGE